MLYSFKHRADAAIVRFDGRVQARDSAELGDDLRGPVDGLHRAPVARVQEHAKSIAERDAGVLLRRVALQHLEARAACGNVVVDRDAIQRALHEARALREIDRAVGIRATAVVPDRDVLRTRLAGFDVAVAVAVTAARHVERDARDLRLRAATAARAPTRDEVQRLLHFVAR